MVTTVPARPEVGEKDEIPGTTLKIVEEVAVALAVFTVMCPVTAAAGTDVVILVEETTLNELLLPPKATVFTWMKPVPVMVTAVPATPDEGVTFVMANVVAEADGAMARRKLPATISAVKAWTIFLLT